MALNALSRSGYPINNVPGLSAPSRYKIGAKVAMAIGNKLALRHNPWMGNFIRKITRNFMRNFMLKICLLALCLTGVVEIADAQKAGSPDSPNGLPVPTGAISLSQDEKIWIDKQRKRLLLDGEVCLKKGPLELLICPWNGKLHESVVRVHSKPSTIHAGLLAIGGEPGAPVSYENDEYQAANGGVVDVILQWKDAQGETQEAHGQDWVRHRDQRADQNNPRDEGIIKRAQNSAEDQNILDGQVESYWVAVHPAFKERLVKEAARNKRHVLRPSSAGKQLEQLMVLSDPRVLDPNVPEPKRYYRTQFSPAKRNDPEHQPLIEQAADKQGDDVHVNGRLKARWEAVFPRQRDEILANKQNVLRPSPKGKQIEELIIRGMPLEHDWVFSGSQIVSDPETGETFYVADRSGEIVCVSNFPTAMIDLPVESSSENARLGFEAATENIPAKGTPVRVILIPHALEKEKSSDE